MTKACDSEIITDQLRVALFEFNSILDFLRYCIDVFRNVKGIRARLASAAGCQPSYLSQVLAGTATLSPEQLFGIARLLKLREEEWEYIREVGLLDRAGREDLRDDCRRRLLRLRAEAQSGKRVAASADVGPLMSADTVMWYVSSWQISAIVTTVANPRTRTPQAIAAMLKLPLARVNDLVGKLLERKLLVRDARGELISNLPERLYIGDDSPGQMFRLGWLSHGTARSQAGYRDGFQKGGVFGGSRAEFDSLREQVAALHRTFFSQTRDHSQTELVGFFGVELFEV